MYQKVQTNANTLWICSNNAGSDVVGTDGLTHIKIAGKGVDGDVSATGISTDNAIVRYDGITGKKIYKISSIIIDDSNNLSGINNLTMSGIMSGPTSIIMEIWF